MLRMPGGPSGAMGGGMGGMGGGGAFQRPRRGQQPLGGGMGGGGMPPATGDGLTPGQAGMAPGMTPGGSMGAAPPGLDPKAIAADPQGFQRWMQGYQQQQGQAQPGTPGDYSAVGGPLMRSTAAGALGGDTPPWEMSAINPNQSLTGQQIMPGTSATATQAQGWATGAGQKYNDFAFKPWEAQNPLDYEKPRTMLTDAQSAMQGLQYNWEPINEQFTNAQNALETGRLASSGQLGGIFNRAGGDFGITAGGAASANTGRLNQELDAAAAGLEGPDRTKLAADALGLLEERSTPGFERSLRSVMARNAAMGRRGSGITTNELGDVTLARERELGLARRDLANQAAGQTLQDRLNVSQARQGIAAQRFGGETFNAGLADNAAGRAMNASMASASNRLQGLQLQRGLAGDLYNQSRDKAAMGMDLADRRTGQQRDSVRLGQDQASFSRGIAGDLAGLTRDEYGATRDERDARRRDEYDQFGAARNRYGDFRQALGEERQNDYNQRQEARGERSWQYGLQRDAIGDEYTRANFEEQLRNNRYNRASGMAGLGFGQSPMGAYQSQGQSYGQNANDWYTLAGEAANYMGQRGRRSGASGGRRSAGGGAPPMEEFRSGYTDS